MGAMSLTYPIQCDYGDLLRSLLKQNAESGYVPWFICYMVTFLTFFLILPYNMRQEVW
jgi:hypothetical protein